MARMWQRYCYWRRQINGKDVAKMLLLAATILRKGQFGAVMHGTWILVKNVVKTFLLDDFYDAISPEHSSSEIRVILTNVHQVDTYFLHLTT